MNNALKFTMGYVDGTKKTYVIPLANILYLLKDESAITQHTVHLNNGESIVVPEEVYEHLIDMMRGANENE